MSSSSVSSGARGRVISCDCYLLGWLMILWFGGLVRGLLGKGYVRFCSWDMGGGLSGCLGPLI